MKHIVFLVGSYYPNYSAVGKCIANIADCFSSRPEEYKVTVIAWNTEYGESFTYELNHQHIHRVSTVLYQRRLYFQSQLKSTTGLRQKLSHFGLLWCRTCNAAKIFLSNASIDPAWVKAYQSELEQLQEPIDAIVPTCSPFEAIVAAIEYSQKKSIDMFPVLFDQFAANDTLHRNKTNRQLKMKINLKNEQIMFDSSAYVYAMPTWKSHILDSFPKYLSKVSFVEHPLLVQNKATNITKKSDATTIVYTGAVDVVIRPMSNIAEIIEHLLDNSVASVAFAFYIFGNDCVSIDRLQEKYPSAVVNRGKVPEKEAKEAISNASILLSAGNTDSNQFPSKIFDYISCGLPIIHFYIKEDDPVIETLRRYPLGICLPQDKSALSKTVEQFASFLQENTGKRIAFDRAISLYPEASPNMLVTDITKHLHRSGGLAPQ